MPNLRRPLAWNALPPTRWKRLFALAAGLGAWTSACSKLPEFAEPRSAEAGEYDPDSGDMIRYRMLERSDFQSERPPPVVKQGPYVLGAQTCAHLRSSPDVRVDLVTKTAPDGTSRTEGRLRNLRFFAYMDRRCSWWNPTNDDVAYTLEHEQIHFAISELEARKLNREAKKLMQELHVTGDSKEEVVAEIQKRLEELVEEHNEDALDRNRDFDEETSVGKNPARQKEWWKTVSRELAETEAWR